MTSAHPPEPLFAVDAGISVMAHSWRIRVCSWTFPESLTCRSGSSRSPNQSGRCSQAENRTSSQTESDFQVETKALNVFSLAALNGGIFLIKGRDHPRLDPSTQLGLVPPLTILNHIKKSRHRPGHSIEAPTGTP